MTRKVGRAIKVSISRAMKLLPGKRREGEDQRKREAEDDAAHRRGDRDLSGVEQGVEEKTRLQHLQRLRQSPGASLVGERLRARSAREDRRTTTPGSTRAARSTSRQDSASRGAARRRLRQTRASSAIRLASSGGEEQIEPAAALGQRRQAGGDDAHRRVLDIGDEMRELALPMHLFQYAEIALQRSSLTRQRDILRPDAEQALGARLFARRRGDRGWSRRRAP